MSYVYVAATVLLTVYGQLVVKWQVGDTARLADPSQRTAFLLALLGNPWVLSAFAAAFGAALCWMLAMVKLELGHAYPFISLSFVLVLFLSALFFGEPLSWQKMAGVALIVGGVALGSQG
jgi:drug/metabolite transporter (DMT)-like permease